MVDYPIDTVGDSEHGDAGDERQHKGGFLMRLKNDVTYTVLQIIRPAQLPSFISMSTLAIGFAREQESCRTNQRRSGLGPVRFNKPSDTKWAGPKIYPWGCHVET